MRIGILGGTFDPIHYGHLHAAAQAQVTQGLDRVLFVPANRSPLKPAAWASTNHRAAMVDLAIADHASFALSPVDIERPPPSYAIDTVADLRQAQPDADFVFLIGADQLADLPQWRAPERILALAPIVALTRPGVAQANADILPHLSAAARDRITVQEIPAVDISASAIRERLAAGKLIRGLTPSAVVAYIERHELYVPASNDRSR